MVVVCDTFNWEDFPLYVLPGENVREIVADYTAKSEYKVMEVYDLNLDMDEQMNEHRAFHY